MNSVRFSLCCLLVATLFGCGTGGAEFTTKLASDFAPAHHTVSVLGVYQDGRMSLDSWAVLGPYLTRALGPDRCPVGYDLLATSNQDLANAIDEFARDEGPTGKLLTELAPAARGDLILVVTFAGKLPAHRTQDEGRPAGPVPNGMGSSRHRGRGRGVSQGSAEPDANELDISASLFSVAQSRPVALVGMQYRGESVADAMSRFAQELAIATPDLKCVGWNQTVKIDAAKLRPSLEIPSETRE